LQYPDGCPPLVHQKQGHHQNNTDQHPGIFIGRFAIADLPQVPKALMRQVGQSFSTK
jgi:hypothetical protein